MCSAYTQRGERAALARTWPSGFFCLGLVSDGGWVNVAGARENQCLRKLCLVQLLGMAGERESTCFPGRIQWIPVPLAVVLISPRRHSTVVKSYIRGFLRGGVAEARQPCGTRSLLAQHGAQLRSLRTAPMQQGPTPLEIQGSNHVGLR